VGTDIRRTPQSPRFFFLFNNLGDSAPRDRGQLPATNGDIRAAGWRPRWPRGQVTDGRGRAAAGPRSGNKMAVSSGPAVRVPRVPDADGRRLAAAGRAARRRADGLRFGFNDEKDQSNKSHFAIFLHGRQPLGDTPWGTRTADRAAGRGIDPRSVVGAEKVGLNHSYAWIGVPY
jgi:hypothetical protein